MVDTFLAEQDLKPIQKRFVDSFPLGRGRGSAWFRDRHLAGEQLAILNPGAGWPCKLWPVERYGQVAVHLGRERGMRSLVVWAGPSERAMAETIVADGAGYAVLAPATTMRELASLCRRAVLFIGSDTGPLHLAVAVGTPSISLHGPTRAEWTGAYGAGNRRIQGTCTTGTGPAKSRRQADNRAMQAITVDQVIAACDELLGQSEQPEK